MAGHVKKKIIDGIDSSEAVIVFLTKNYLDKVIPFLNLPAPGLNGYPPLVRFATTTQTHLLSSYIALRRIDGD